MSSDIRVTGHKKNMNTMTNIYLTKDTHTQYSPVLYVQNIGQKKFPVRLQKFYANVNVA